MKKKPRRGRWRRWCLRALGLLVVLAVAARWGGPMAVRRWGLPWLERQAERALGGSVRIGGFEWEGLGVLRLTGLRIEGPAGALLREVSLDTLQARLSPESWLADGRLPLSAIDARGLRARIDLEGAPPGAGAGEAAQEPRVEPAQSAVSVTRLPPLRLEEADVELLLGEDRLAWRGLRAELSRGRLAATWASLDADVAVGAALLRGAGVLDASVEAGSASFPRVRELTLSIEGRRLIEHGALEVSSSDILEARGELAWLGLTLAPALYDPGAERVEVTASAREAPVDEVLALLGLEPRVGALVTGVAHASFPTRHPREWTLDAELESGPLRSSDVGAQADAVRAHATRAAGGLLEADILLVGLVLPPLQEVDLTAQVRLGLGEGNEGSALVLREVVARASGAVLEGEAVLDLAVGELRHAAVRGLEAATAAWADALGLELEAEAPGRCAFLVQASGPYRDITRLEATAVLAWKGEGEPSPEVEADLSLADCVVDVPRVVWRRGEDHAVASLEGTWSAGSSPRSSLRVRSASGLLRCVPIDLSRPATLLWEDGVARADLGLFTQAEGVLDVWGERRADGELLLRASAILRDVAGVAGLLEASSAGAGGPAEMEAALEWRPGGDEGAAGSDPWLLLECALPSARVPLGAEALEGARVRASLIADAGQLEADASLLRAGRLDVSAHARCDAAWDPIVAPRVGGSFEATASADAPDLLALLGPLAGVDFVEGAASATARLQGVVGAGGLPRIQRLDADLELARGSLRAPGKVPPLGDVAATLRLREGRLTVEGLTARAYSAPVKVSGWVDLDLPWTTGAFGPRGVDLRIESKSLLLVNEPDLRVRGDVDVSWKGPVAASEVAGALRITRGYYQRDIALTQRSGVRLPLSLFSITTSPFDAARLAVRIQSDQTLLLRNNVVSTRASADLLLGGTGREPLLTGLVSATSGQVRLLTANLALRESFIEFLAADPLNPRLGIGVETRVRGYDIDVVIGGTYEEPEILLNAAPPLEREKILLLISTGLTLDEIEDRGVGRVAAAQAATYAAQLIVNRLSRGDPEKESVLSRLRFESESARSSGYEDVFRVEFKAFEDLILEGDEVYLQAERDTYGDYNVNAGIRFELR